MISESAVKEWLARPLKDSNKAKLFPEEVLDAKIAALPVPPRFVTAPHKHQKVCFLLGVTYPGYNFWLDPGGGKSKVLLDLLRYRLREKTAKRCLILVPQTTNLYEWEDETAIHQPKISITVLDGSRQEREERLWGDTLIVVATYAGLLHLVCQKVVRVIRGKKKTMMVPDPKRMRKLLEEFDFIGLDETSVNLRSHTSLTFQVCRWFIHSCYVYGLTGTPFDQEDPHDCWSEFYVIDEGETLGPTLGIFREAFFTTKRGYFGGYEHNFKKGMTDKLHRMMAHRSIYYSEDEMFDMPKMDGGIFNKKGPPNIRRVVFSDETWAYYHKLIEDLKQAKGNFTLVESVFLRMRQLTSGYLSVKDPEGERVTIKFKNNPKLDALIQAIREVPKGRKILVFCYYRMSGEIVYEGLQKAKLGRRISRISGETPKGRRRSIFRTFKSGGTDILVLSTAGAYGLNLQIANWLMMFETPTSSIERKQVERRLRPAMNARRVHILDFAVKGSWDEKVLKALKNGADFFRQLMEGTKKAKVARVRW